MGMTRATAECTIGDETLVMHPLTIKNIEEIDNWMRVGFLRAIRESADGDQVMIATGMHEMLKLSFFSRAGQQALASLEGIAKVLSVSTDIEYEKAAKLVRIDSSMDSFNAAFRLLNGSSEKKTEGGVDPMKAMVT